MKIIEQRVTEVAKDILSRNYVDLSELSAALKATISITIEDLLRNEVEDLQDKKTQLSAIIHNQFAGKFQKEKAHQEIIRVSKELKKRNRAIRMIEDDSERKNIRRFIKERYGSTFWDEYGEFKQNLSLSRL